VMPMSDPRGNLFSHLEPVRADLKAIFTRAYLGVIPANPNLDDPFFSPVAIPAGQPVGEQFKLLYASVAAREPPDSVLHLCFIDRVSFALQTTHQAAFLADLRAIQDDDLPLLFLRSPAAWETHPQNYREIEEMATQLGRWVLGKTLDFAWCHLAIRAGQLREIINEVHTPDLTILAEMLLQIHGIIKTKAVDWLAWEDPFILGRPAAELKREREESRDETRKRMGYILPTLQILCERGQVFIGRLQAEQVDLPRLEELDEPWEE
ncbi:MAG: hypothetical protein IH586_06755, partial [Anaerolineaceae bacterium]|nr:hypothetical protein [Anaerolineaceae bacterium]